MVNRRTALKAGGLLALLGVGAGTASADAQGQVGTDSDPLEAVYTEELNGGVTGDQSVTDLLGDGLKLSSEALSADLGTGLEFNSGTTRVDGRAVAGNVLSENGSNPSQVDVNIGNALTNNSGTLTVNLNQVGSGTGILNGVDSNGIEYRSLGASDGMSLTETGGTITLGMEDTTIDTRSSFTLNDVTAAKSAARIEGGALLADGRSTASRGNDNNTLTNQRGNKWGIEIEPQVPIAGIEVTISSNTSGDSNVYLVDGNGNTITQVPSPGAGNLVKLFADLAASTTYGVWVDAEDGGQRDTPDYPFTTEYIDITSGSYDQSGSYTTHSDAFNIRNVTAFPKVEAAIEWPDQTPVGKWDTATYEAQQSGGGVEVYVQTSADGGTSWSDWRSRPIGSGTDLSAIPTDQQVRFRAELYRSEYTDIPRLTQLSRQWRP